MKGWIQNPVKLSCLYGVFVCTDEPQHVNSLGFFAQADSHLRNTPPVSRSDSSSVQRAKYRADILGSAQSLCLSLQP